MARSRVTRTPSEILEADNTRVTRSEFERGFQRFLKEQRRNDLAVSAAQLNVFFTISREFLREDSGFAEVNAKKEAILQEFTRCERLMSDIERRLKERIKAFQAKGGVLIEELSRSVIESIDGACFDFRHKLEAQKRVLEGMKRKTLRYEYVIDLEKFLADEFSSLKQMDKDVLIAAALASAGVFTEEEIEQDVLERIPMERSRAREYYKEVYGQTGVERCYSWIPSKKGGGEKARTKNEGF